MDAELGSSNRHLGSGDGLPSTGDAHAVTVDIDPSALLITDSVMDTCGTDKTMAAQSGADDLESSDGTLCNEGEDSPKLFARQ
ncbi:hypothetical protein BGX31_004873, partial [Mortierella sp. GBA43]